ncbi:MAG: hypothetical protein ACI9W4_001850, partial [Rhodothermales bacterium]
VSHPKLGSIGVAYYTGTYNTWRVEGDGVDDKRGLRILTLDVAASAGSVNLVGEAALAWIDVPAGLATLHGDRQQGAFLDVIYPFYQGTLGSLRTAIISASVRLEYADMNVGSFQGGGNIEDEQTAVALGFSLRPNSETVFKLNYRYHWQDDLLGNPSRLAGVQAGFATYF